jgi:ferredoxin-NADP reductase
MQNNKGREFILINKRIESKDVVSLYFDPEDGNPFSFISGQYVNVKHPNIPNHGKSYTISSSPNENHICLTIKRKGAMSSMMIDSEIGAKVTFSGPYGYFFPEKYDKDIVFLAGGIGITPFFSILKDKLGSIEDKKIYLFYSNKTTGDIVFFDDIDKLSKKTSKLITIYTLTQEKTSKDCGYEFSRIDKKMLNKYLTSIKGKYYYICGSISFVNNMWKLIKSFGVSEGDIFTESFF